MDCEAIFTHLDHHLVLLPSILSKFLFTLKRIDKPFAFSLSSSRVNIPHPRSSQVKYFPTGIPTSSLSWNSFVPINKTHMFIFPYCSITISIHSAHPRMKENRLLVHSSSIFLWFFDTHLFPP